MSGRVVHQGRRASVVYKKWVRRPPPPLHARIILFYFISFHECIGSADSNGTRQDWPASGCASFVSFQPQQQPARSQHAGAFLQRPRGVSFGTCNQIVATSQTGHPGACFQKQFLQHYIELKLFFNVG